MLCGKPRLFLCLSCGLFRERGLLPPQGFGKPEEAELKSPRNHGKLLLFTR